MKTKNKFVTETRAAELMKEAFEAGKYLQKHANRGSYDCPYWGFMEWCSSKNYCDVTRTKFTLRNRAIR